MNLQEFNTYTIICFLTTWISRIMLRIKLHLTPLTIILLILGNESTAKSSYCASTGNWNTTVNYDITLGGDWTENGSFLEQIEGVRFDGTAAQTIRSSLAVLWAHNQ